MVIVNAVKRITVLCNAAAQAQKVRPFTTIVSPHLIFNCTWKVLMELSRNDNGFAPKMQVDDFLEATGPTIEKEELATEVQKNLAAVNKALQYVMYLKLKYVCSILTNNSLYIDLTNWENLVVYNFQITKFPSVFEWLSDSVVATL